MRALLVVIMMVSTSYGKVAVSAADLVQKALADSQLTLPGSQPFHLKARLYEITDHDLDPHGATIEEYWAAPDRWTRTVISRDFSETLTVHGATTRARVIGDFYPGWLQNMVTAIFDPAAAWQDLDLAHVTVQKAPGKRLCSRFTLHVGISPATNDVFSFFCFQHGLLEQAGMPGYSVFYSDYKAFGTKYVARTLREPLGNGSQLYAVVDELNEITPSDSAAAISDGAPELKTIFMGEEEARSRLISSSDMPWPAAEAGWPMIYHKKAGVLSICIVIDIKGRVRETFPLQSDNLQMTNIARKAVMEWRFKPATSNGTPVQIRSILTFAFDTKRGK